MKEISVFTELQLVHLDAKPNVFKSVFNYPLHLLFGKSGYVGSKKRAKGPTRGTANQQKRFLFPNALLGPDLLGFYTKVPWLIVVRIKLGQVKRRTGG